MNEYRITIAKYYMDTDLSQRDGKYVKAESIGEAIREVMNRRGDNIEDTVHYTVQSWPDGKVIHWSATDAGKMEVGK